MAARRREIDARGEDGARDGQDDGADGNVRDDLAEDERDAAHGPHERQLEALFGPLAREGAGRGREERDDEQREDAAQREVDVELARAGDRAVARDKRGEGGRPGDGGHEEEERGLRPHERLQLQTND